MLWRWWGDWTLPSDAITDFLKRVVRSPCLIRYMAPAYGRGGIAHFADLGDAVLQMLKKERNNPMKYIVLLLALLFDVLSIAQETALLRRIRKSRLKI